MSDNPKPRRGKAPLTATVERIAQVLEALRRSRNPISMTELARQLDVSQSAMSRLASALIQEGFLERDEDTDNYRLGVRLIVWGRAALETRSLQRVARPHLEDFVRTVGEDASLAVLQGSRIVYLEYLAHDESLGFGVRPGRLVPAHTSAMGKVLLAEFPNDRVTELLRESILKPLTPRSITSLTEFLGQLEDVRATGVATDDEETNLGVRCVAAPIRDDQGHTVAAISTSGWTAKMTYERVAQLAPILRATAGRISASLGHVGQSQSG